MKTKLLKKVRKRYSIVRIDSLERNPPELLSIAKGYCSGFPFFMLYDSYNSYRTSFDKEKGKLMKRLVNWIVNDYGSPNRRGRKEKKVWW